MRFREANRLRLRKAAMLGGVLLMLGTVPTHGRSYPVRHRTAQAVYLEAGSQAGLSVGDRLEIWRGNESIAEVEVAFVAGFSASCKVLRETQPIRPGDQARLPVARVGELTSSTSTAVARSSQGGESSYSGPRRAGRSPTRISGVLAVEYEAFTDDSGRDLDYDRSQARLSLRGRDVGGLPLSFRVRSRLQEIRRDRDLSGGVPASESRDRLYEVSLRYDAENGRYSLLAGRLGAAPFISLGYLDGVLAEVRAYKSLRVGGFWGNQPEGSEISFDSIGEKYGGYMRFSNDGSSSARRFDVVLGGVREEGELDVSREYALLETYYHAGGVWSLFQRAEIDFNNGWREELSADSSQLSNLALSARARLSETVRLVISYDQFQQYRTETTRSIPEELFDDLLRQGFRVGLNLGRPRALNWSLSAGWRGQEDADESAVSFGIGARHPNVGGGISLAGDLLAYSNLYGDGGVLRLRSSKFFAGGHELYLDLGARTDRSDFGEEDELTDTWGRLGFWAELPARLFARGELEYSSGDSLEGSRITIGVGYRF